MKVDVRFLCAILIAVVKCNKVKRGAGNDILSNLQTLETLNNEQTISKRSQVDNFPDPDGVQVDLERRSRLDRMPAIFGKRSRLDRMPAVFGKRSRLSRMPAVFGKRSPVDRMPAYFGKRSRISRMPAVFGKRSSSLERMPMVFGKRDLFESGNDHVNMYPLLPESEQMPSSLDMYHLKSGKLTVGELAYIIRNDMHLLVPIISDLMDKNSDGFISLAELQSVKEDI